MLASKAVCFLFCATLAFSAATARADGGPGQIRLFIDVPGPQTGPVLGTATFSGWAIDGVAAINEVAVSIDGVAVGTAVYGSSRPDVCAAFPGEPNCPNVGWTITLDTTLFASGAHTLAIIATSADGEQASAHSSFTIANWLDAGVDPIRVDIDRPNAASGIFVGTASFGGWAIDDIAAISAVSVSIDGVPYGNASYGVNRPDVCSVFPNRAGCPNVGWGFAIDTSVLADGIHLLAVTAISIAGESTTATSSFLTANLISSNPIRMSIDIPNASNPSFSGTAHFGGWALDDSAAISTVNVLVDGVSYGIAPYGGARPDVCDVFPGRPSCPNVGWNFLLDTTLLPNGAHVLEVTANASDGGHATLGRAFTIANPAPENATRLFVDVPGPQNSIVIGSTTFSGWAINDNAPIANVTVFVDGTPYGSAQYGSSRPDVCVVFPGRAGCPNVGWSIVLDTTRISDGGHTLTVQASAANGQRAAATSTFTVANWTPYENPFHVTSDRPNSSNSVLSGLAAVGGWAINAIAAITNVAISVDGIPYGNAVYGGLRPDVCAVYANLANCPNVGWNFLLDTTTLTDGAHVLGITVTSSGGQHYTTTVLFTSQNQAQASADPSSLLTSDDVVSVIQHAAEAIDSTNAVIAVTDRLGNVLGVFRKPNATATAIGNFGAAVDVNELAVALARTASFFSNNQAPLSSRTVRYISGIHFPPGISYTSNAALYGIENTNRGCPLNTTFLPGQNIPPARSINGTGVGLGVITGKADVYDSDPTAVNPGGVPLFKSGVLVGGVGVAGVSQPAAEYAAFSGAVGAGFGAAPAAPGVVVIDGISLPFVDQQTPPPGVQAGSFVGSWLVNASSSPGPAPEGYLVAPVAGPLGGLAQADVEQIINGVIAEANLTRAVIRLPDGSRARFVIAVADLDGTLIGLYRMADATVFSIDVAVAKARNVIYFSGPNRQAGDLPGVPMGTAVTNRTISFGAQPLFPPGIDGSGPGPFFALYQFDTLNPCTQGQQPPNQNQNGIVFFPGSLPLYRNGVLVGGLGVSGDGVDQDDFVANAGAAAFQAPASIRADQVLIDGVRLPYQKFPRDPTN